MEKKENKKTYTYFVGDEVHGGITKIQHVVNKSVTHERADGSQMTLARANFCTALVPANYFQPSRILNSIIFATHNSGIPRIILCRICATALDAASSPMNSQDSQSAIVLPNLIQTGDKNCQTDAVLTFEPADEDSDVSMELETSGGDMRISDIPDANTETRGTITEENSTFVNLPPKNVLPDPRFHGLCFCCFRVDLKTLSKYEWGFNQRTDIAEVISFRKNFGTYGSSHSDDKITCTSECAHGLCYCCYIGVPDEMQLPIISWPSTGVDEGVQWSHHDSLNSQANDFDDSAGADREQTFQTVDSQHTLLEVPGKRAAETLLSSSKQQEEACGSDCSRDLFTPTDAFESAAGDNDVAPESDAEADIDGNRVDDVLNLSFNIVESCTGGPKSSEASHVALKSAVPQLTIPVPHSNTRINNVGPRPSTFAGDKLGELEFSARHIDFTPIGAPSKMVASSHDENRKTIHHPQPLKKRPIMDSSMEILSQARPLKSAKQEIIPPVRQSIEVLEQSKAHCSSDTSTAIVPTRIAVGVRTGEKLHACWFCRKTYSSHQVLRKHLVSHDVDITVMKTITVYVHGECYVEHCYFTSANPEEHVNHLRRSHKKKGQLVKRGPPLKKMISSQNEEMHPVVCIPPLPSISSAKATAAYLSGTSSVVIKQPLPSTVKAYNPKGQKGGVKGQLKEKPSAPAFQITTRNKKKKDEQ